MCRNGHSNVFGSGSKLAKGFVGSITHSASWAAAIAARSETFEGLGIDLEACQPLEPDLQTLIMRPDELQNLPPTLTLNMATTDTTTAVFAIKEAVYKAVYPLIHQVFDFQAVSVNLDERVGRFSAKLHLSHDDVLHRVVSGSICRQLDHVLAIAVIRGK
jgi:enterobactin synthetase component D